MRTTAVALILALLPMVAAAAGTYADPEDRGYPEDYPGTPVPPPGGEGISIYVEDGQEGPQQNFGVQPIHDNEVFAIFRGDRLEYQGREGEDLFLWDVQAWAGTDYDKLWFKSEGEKPTDGKTNEAEAELLYSRNIASFWDFQIGLRHDFEPRPSRTSLAAGFQGLVPYWFETEATAYLSEDGDLSANLEPSTTSFSPSASSSSRASKRTSPCRRWRNTASARGSTT